MRRSMLMRQRLVLVFLIGLLLFYSPLTTLFDQPMAWFGVPVLYLYLFIAWLSLIGLLAWIVEGRHR